MKDYAVVLREVPRISEEIVKAYNRNDFTKVSSLAEEIGTLYSDDELMAHRIGHMAQIVASAAYFGGIVHEVNVHNEERMRRFEPPF